MSTEFSQTNGPSTALALPSTAERRVQRAKQRIAEHFALLDHRARFVARQTAWVAGMVLLGLAGMAAAATLFGSRKHSRRRSGVYYASRAGAGGAGTALMLAAFGLLSRRARQARTGSYSM